MTNRAYPRLAGFDDAMIALGNEKRRRILIILAARDHTCTSKLAKLLPDGQSAVSQNLGMLRDVGIVDFRQVKQRHEYEIMAGLDVFWDGKEVWFRLNARKTHAFGLEVHYEPDASEMRAVGEFIVQLPPRNIPIHEPQLETKPKGKARAQDEETSMKKRSRSKVV